MRPRTVILHNPVSRGAAADEADVLVQLQAVRAALLQLGHEVSELAFPTALDELARQLRDRAPDQVFNLVESVAGSPAQIHRAPGWLARLGIPFTGAGAVALYLTSSKLLAKRWLARNGLPTPRLLPEEGQGADLAGPWIVKPVWEDASVGIDDTAVVAGAAGARALLRARRAAGGEWFAEQFIEGREMNVALLAGLLAGEREPLVLPPAELRFVDYPATKPRIVGYAAKWEDDSFESSHTPRVFPDSAADAGLIRTLRELAARCWGLFGLQGYARVDFRVDARGAPWILEINANPCLSPDAGFVAALAAGGVSFPDAVQRILADLQPARADHARPLP